MNVRDSNSRISVYHRILDRARKTVEDAEEQSLEGLKYEIEKATEFEADVEELARNEVDLIAAYVKRDLGHIYHFMAETGQGIADWLHFDVQLLEDRTWQWLSTVAVKTTVELASLQQQFEIESALYSVNEVAGPGLLICQQCGHRHYIHHTDVVKACTECGFDQFRRPQKD